MHDTLVCKKTKDSVTRSLVTDGAMNTVYMVSGTIKNEGDSTFDILSLDTLSGKPKDIRVDGLQFSVETGLKVFLKYRDKPFVIPLEGRTKMDLGWIGGIQGHEISLVCKGVGSFFVVFDISKLGV